MREPWESGPRDGPRRRFHEPRGTSRGLVPRGRDLEPEPGHDPPVPSGEARYEHRFLLCPSVLVPLLVWLALVPVAVLGPAARESTVVGALAWMVPLALVVLVVLIVPRTARRVRVDGGGLWVSGHLAVPAGEIRAVVPLSFAAAGGAATRVLPGLAWTTMYRVDGTPALVSSGRRRVVDGVVGVPADWDGQNAGRAWLGGALVVTGRVEDGLLLGWALPSYRRYRLVDALVAVAPRVDAPRPLLHGLDVPDKTAVEEVVRRHERRRAS